jgi:hypothetical protein
VLRSVLAQRDGSILQRPTDIELVAVSSIQQCVGPYIYGMGASASYFFAIRLIASVNDFACLVGIGDAEPVDATR